MTTPTAAAGAAGAVAAAALVDAHFAARGALDHINYSSFRDLFARMGGAPCTILETGTSAWGTDSTRLFNAYVRAFGGALWTVDVRDEAARAVLPDLEPGRATAVVGDSVAFLREWVRDHPGVSPDVVYLDSMDVDFRAPEPAALHGLAEFAALRPALRPGALLLIDDTPADPAHHTAPGDAVVAAAWAARGGLMPGKGMLVVEAARRGELPELELLHHRYQVLYRVVRRP
jgi:hypothetical protein